MKSEICTILSGKNFTKCENEYYITLKVKIFHPDTLRISWQTWRFCREHFFKFIEDNGKGWFSIYRNGKSKCPVVGFKEW